MANTTFRVVTFLAPNMLPVYQTLVRYLGDQRMLLACEHADFMNLR